MWFIVTKDCGFDFIVRNLNTKLLYTATRYQVKSFLIGENWGSSKKLHHFCYF